MNTKSLDIKKLLLDNGIIIVLLLLVLFTGIMKDNFFSASNLRNVLVNVAPRVIIAFGVSACLITKGTDLSAGRLVGLSACVAGTLLQNKDYANKMFPNLGDMNILVVLLIAMYKRYCYSSFERSGLYRNTWYAAYSIWCMSCLYKG